MATICRPRPSNLLQFSWLKRLLLASLGGWVLALSPVAAQPEPLPMLPVKTPKPLNEVKSFVDDLPANDAAFEVFVGQSRILTIKGKAATIAVGDPSVVDFTIISPRQIRLVGQRIGTTDLSVITADDQVFSFEVHVVADLDPLRAQLRQLFPDAQLKLTHMRDHLVVEGEARDTAQVSRIVDTIKAYQKSVYATELRKITGAARAAQPPVPVVGPPREGPPVAPVAGPELGAPLNITATVLEPRLINLIRVPGPQQVLLKVRVAELNRTALRQIGTDIIGFNRKNGLIVGSQIGGAGTVVTGGGNVGGIPSPADLVPSATTAFGVFNKADFEIFFTALRKNSVLKILAEPNVVALNGHKASFLAGGKFPVPVAQSSSGGAAPAVTVQFEPFGVSLDFVPQILDGDAIRLAVHPVVSSVDPALGTVLVPGGTPVPGIDSREVQTTVELKQGQTLAIGGLLQLTMDGTTSRIPFLGDLPILGTFFSNTTGNRVEKELIVLITPYLVEPMNPDQVPPTPGDEVKGPNDLELYFLGRIEGRTGRDFRATTEYDDALHVLRHFLKLEKDHVCGPHGFSE